MTPRLTLGIEIRKVLGTTLALRLKDSLWSRLEFELRKDFRKSMGCKFCLKLGTPEILETLGTVLGEPFGWRFRMELFTALGCKLGLNLGKEMGARLGSTLGTVLRTVLIILLGTTLGSRL